MMIFTTCKYLGNWPLIHLPNTANSCFEFIGCSLTSRYAHSSRPQVEPLCMIISFVMYKFLQNSIFKNCSSITQCYCFSND